jgi:hypothetical protein
VATLKVKQQTPVVFPTAAGMGLGDVLLVNKRRRQLRDIELSARGTIVSARPGKIIKILEHAAFVVDENLVFEKPDGGFTSPFRLVSLEGAVAPYRTRSNIEVQLRRVSKTVPPPREAFGGTAYAVEESFAKPLPSPLKDALLLNKELDFPHENTFSNNYSQIIDLGIRFNKQTGRYSLLGSATRGGTYKKQLLQPTAPTPAPAPR